MQFENRVKRFNNIGYIDRGFRIVLSLGLIGVVMSYGETDVQNLGWITVLALLALYPITTAIIGWDPIYRWLKINTRRNRILPSDSQLDHTASETYDKMVDHHIVPPSAEKQEELDRKSKHTKDAA